MIKKITLLLVLLFVVVNIYAQESKVEKADKKFNQYAFVDARKIYLEVAEKGYESADLFQKIADSYYFNGEYGKAEEWYNKLVTNYKDEIRPEYFFRFSQTLRSMKKYDRADEMMRTFNELSKDDVRGELFEEEPNYLRNIEYIKSTYVIENIRSLNSRYSDFAPTEYEGNLIFASSRDTGGATKKIHKWNNEPFLDLYQTKKKADSEDYKLPTAFSTNLNSKFHESTTTFTKDGNTVYFTRNNYTNGTYRKSKTGTNKLKIYRSQKVEGKWTVAEEMPFNSDEYSTAHPTLNADDTKLYFASDMDGTVGLSDIWVVDIDSNGAVSEPLNLGRPVNTEGRETFPFMSTSGVLYFASDGHPGLGGLDVFATTPRSSAERTEKIDNVGVPINSSYDDFTFILNDDTRVGYFASNRKEGMGSDDIYRFVKEEVPCVITLKGKVLNEDSQETIEDATVSLIDQNGEVLNTVTTTSEGTYSFNEVACEMTYIVRAGKELYTTSEEIVKLLDEPGTVSTDLKIGLLQKKVEVGDDLSLVLDLNPIYFDFDKAYIRKDAALELEKVISVMKQYPNMIIETRSHTDSRGDDTYNLGLSQRRAKSTVEFIVSQGIDGSRITGEGYGEKELVNECANGVTCSEAQHELNRRSEFIVIKY